LNIARSATANDYAILCCFLADLRDWLLKESNLPQVAELANEVLIDAVNLRDDIAEQAADLETRVLYLVPPIKNN
jgi:hypothetical protein